MYKRSWGVDPGTTWSKSSGQGVTWTRDRQMPPKNQSLFDFISAVQYMAIHFMYHLVHSPPIYCFYSKIGWKILNSGILENSRSLVKKNRSLTMRIQTVSTRHWQMRTCPHAAAVGGRFYPVSQPSATPCMMQCTSLCHWSLELDLIH